MPDSFVLTVSALNRYVKSILDSDTNLQSVFVRGEISNFSANAYSGHYYMTIKDENAQIRAAMFKSANSRLRFMPENSMSVIIRGRVSLYEKGGEYQLIIDDMQPDGTGALALAYEQLKKRLEAKGMFDPAHKKPIPAFPSKIGVATSETGAAVRDIINIISRRYPVCEIVLCPVSVQGENAAPQIAEAVKLFNRKKNVDVIIVGRGGGSIEDLWAFNEEIVADAVYESEIPVISAVGHETDFTICDFVADLRAPTPSAAAELAVPDINIINDTVYNIRRSMYSSVMNSLSLKQSVLDSMKIRIESGSPSKYIDNLSLRCDSAVSSITSSADKYMLTKQSELKELMLRIDAVSPLRILSKGYSVVIKDGKTVSDSSVLEKGDIIDIRMNKGKTRCEVIE